MLEIQTSALFTCVINTHPHEEVDIQIYLNLCVYTHIYIAVLEGLHLETFYHQGHILLYILQIPQHWKANLNHFDFFNNPVFEERS